MTSAAHTPPIQIADSVWIVQTPLRFLGMQVGRRMTAIRLSGGEIFIHSPAQLTAELRTALDRLGPVRYVVPASSLHGHLFMEQYRDAYPDALLFAAPGLERRRRDLQFEGQLGDAPDPSWAEDIDQALFPASRLGPEVLFLHRQSRSLLVGDVVWSVSSSLPVLPRLWAGWRARVAPTPLFRRSIRDRSGAHATLHRILDWDFERIIVGHGEIVEAGGREALRGAYAELLRE